MVGKSVQYPPGPSQHRESRRVQAGLAEEGVNPADVQVQRREVPSSFGIDFRDCEARVNPSGPRSGEIWAEARPRWGGCQGRAGF